MTPMRNSGGGARGNRRRRSHSRDLPMSEINVTPFVDVMLVLLVVFMVAAPLLTVGVPVELPETAAESLPMPEEEPLTITIRTDGGLSIQNTEIARDQLIPRLSAIAEERSDRQLFLRADQGISYGQVMQVMGALNAAGFNRIGLVTEDGGPTLGGE
ncbi:protein TolR [Mangrovicoccus ximenensis]|uniref:protein TolR n=1 Tax=Mangrovicoccus ximenensis TaxID=1911570 RepID=UPI001F0002D6|nr:protein TolR [Mangrovicoccus ximenensis]